MAGLEPIDTTMINLHGVFCSNVVIDGQLVQATIWKTALLKKLAMKTDSPDIIDNDSRWIWTFFAFSITNFRYIEKSEPPSSFLMMTKSLVMHLPLMNRIGLSSMTGHLSTRWPILFARTLLFLSGTTHPREQNPKWLDAPLRSWPRTDHATVWGNSRGMLRFESCEGAHQESGTLHAYTVEASKLREFDHGMVHLKRLRMWIRGESSFGKMALYDEVIHTFVRYDHMNSMICTLTYSTAFPIASTIRQYMLPLLITSIFVPSKNIFLKSTKRKNLAWSYQCRDVRKKSCCVVLPGSWAKASVMHIHIYEKLYLQLLIAARVTLLILIWTRIVTTLTKFLWG